MRNPSRSDWVRNLTSEDYAQIIRAVGQISSRPASRETCRRLYTLALLDGVESDFLLRRLRQAAGDEVEP